MKSTICIVEITNQKNEKYLYMRRNLVAWSPPCLMSTKKFSTCVFIEKCFAVLTNQAARFIYLTWYRLLLLFWEFSSIIPFMVWLRDSTLVKSRGGGTFLSPAPSVSDWQALFFFEWKGKCPGFHFLNLSATILNLI